MRFNYAARGAVLFAALTTSALSAAPPELVLPKEVAAEPGTFVVVPATTIGKTVTWKVLDAGLTMFPSALLKDSKTAVVIAQKPGKYRLIAVTAVADEVSEIVETVIVVGNPSPIPDDGKTDPIPEPKPVDPVTPAQLVVVVVDETADRATTLRGKLMFDPAIAARFNDKGHKWRVIDKDVVGADGQTPADVRKFIKLAADKPYPSYYLVDPTGKIRGSGAIPAKMSDFLDAVKKAGG
jgi:hypothetical protein